MAAAVPTLADELHYIPGIQARKVTLADFDLGKQIGQGRYGHVFAARDRVTNGMVALKRLDLDQIIAEGVKNQVKRELEIMQTLKHPNILSLYTYFWDDKYLYLVVEYAARGDLWNRLLNESRFSVHMTAKLVAQLCEAINYAHKHNVIHRDIKPENLLLDANQNLKLADFGWSVLARRPMRTTYCGTPDYIPPEMASSKSYDFRVDIWCIGVFAYECLLGKPPFQADDDAAREKRILAQDYSFPEDPVLPDEAYDLIRNLIQVDPSKRMPLDQVLRHPFITKYYKKSVTEP
eukprot:Sspe_Gene.100587::Locus_75270_Transcript_1_1_Confidence_1.000_Length_977::g.100587::m.100587